MEHNSSATLASRDPQLRSGTLLAALGVVAFSFSLPATAWSLDGFGAWSSVGLRGAIAGAVAVASLVIWPGMRPRPDEWRLLVVVSIGCALGFPLLTTFALTVTSTAHSAVIVGALPMMTATISSIATGHRQARGFWIAAGAGAAVVMGFALSQNHGTPSLGDAFVVGAVVLCAAGYAAGGQLSRHMPGWRVIAWGVVLALPVNVAVAIAGLGLETSHVTPRGVVGLAYIALVSQFGGFVVWYRGMGLIGVARASQLQLAQPLLTVAWAVLLLGEHVSPSVPLAALAVVACIVITQRAGR